MEKLGGADPKICINRIIQLNPYPNTSNFKVKGLRLLLGSPEEQQAEGQPLPRLPSEHYKTDVEKLQGHGALRGKVLALLGKLIF